MERKLLGQLLCCLWTWRVMWLPYRWLASCSSNRRLFLPSLDNLLPTHLLYLYRPKNLHQIQFCSVKNWKCCLQCEFSVLDRIVSMHVADQIPTTNHSQYVLELKLSFSTRFESTRACLSQFKIRHARVISRAVVLRVLIHIDPEFCCCSFFTQAACWFVRSLIRHRKSSFSKYAGKSSYSRWALQTVRR